MRFGVQADVPTSSVYLRLGLGAGWLCCVLPYACLRQSEGGNGGRRGRARERARERERARASERERENERKQEKESER